MKLFRKPFASRVVIILFALNLIHSIFLPTSSFALTGTQHQAEYTSYEEPGNTDLVNMLTGDLTYNLPVIEVPGPERSFSIPLTYHAGIGLDQQASWVGLGWNINAGAITRNINSYPDDANGETQSVNMQDMNITKGWTSSTGIINMGWNNRQGHYGTVSLLNVVEISWKNGISGGGILGATVSQGEWDFDPMKFGQGVMSIVTFGATTTATTLGGIAAEVGKQAAIGAALALVVSAFTGSPSPGVDTGGRWKYTTKTDQRFLHKNYWIWLDKTRTEDMHGLLNLGKATYNNSPNSYLNITVNNNGTTESMKAFNKPSANRGSASDINLVSENDNDATYYNNFYPVLLAGDDYSVNAKGVSGSMTPYRFELGSVSAPREMTYFHERLAPVRYLDYKVPFVYEGAPTNSYFHHVGGTASITSPTPHFGITHEVGNPSAWANTSIKYNLNDVVMKDERIRSDVNAVKKLATGNHVEWHTNEELRDGVTYATGFLDFLPGGAGSGTPRYSFRSNFSLGNSTASEYYYSTTNFTKDIVVPVSVYNVLVEGDPIRLNGNFYATEDSHAEGSGGSYAEISNVTVFKKKTVGSNYVIEVSAHTGFTTYAGFIADVTLSYFKTPSLGHGIGGYVITSADGTNYHFSLPVYDYDKHTEIQQVSDPLKKAIIRRQSPFANTWLLTAITQSDYIDRNENGLADEGDWGGWVKLNYGKVAGDYAYRDPYTGFRNDLENKTKSFTQGKKQLYYLNSVETRSHVALFLKSARADAKGLNNQVTYKLDEIAVLSKSVYNTLLTNGITDFSNSITNLCLSSSFVSSTVRNLVNRNSVKRVVFNHTYELCKGAQNPLNAADTLTENGKLTLASISIKSRGDENTNIIPNYKFHYGFNPAFSQHKWDAWGLYNRYGAQSGDTHRPSKNSLDATAWSLSKITSPMGSEVTINYERDDYGSISEFPVTHSSESLLTDKVLSDGICSPIEFSGIVRTNDRIKLTVREYYTCAGQQIYKDLATVWGRGANGSALVLDNPVTYTTGQSLCPSTNAPGTNYKIVVRVEKQYEPGGNLRVASIVTSDRFGIQQKSRYLYTKADGTSSGVLAKQNPYVSATTYNLDKLTEYPDTPVMYGMVTILNGRLYSDADYAMKTVYEFETPKTTMIVSNTQTMTPKTLIHRYNEYNESGTPYQVDTYTLFKMTTIENHTAKIGNVLSVKTYDQSNTPLTSSVLTYTKNISSDETSYQGLYSSGTLVFEIAGRGLSGHTYYKVNRTTLLRYAYTVKDIQTTMDSQTSTIENTKWDFVTGRVLEKTETSATGVKVKTIDKPAYKVYPAMGSKAISLNNKNMIFQTAATYQYLLDETNKPVGLIGANIQTWKNDWSNYKKFDIGSGTYIENAEGGPVWRTHEEYTYAGNYSQLKGNGTRTMAADFDYTPGAANVNWLKLSTTSRYDHYSMVLEGQDMKGVGAVTKMGYGESVPILTAARAKYNEVAFSGAEDLDAATGFFGSEISMKGSAGQNTIVVKRSTGGSSHSGDCALLVSTGRGFVYRPTGLETKKTYRASVWTNALHGQLYYVLNNGTEQVSLPPDPNQAKSGNWYQLNLDIPVETTFSSLEVGVKSQTGAQVVFDDFRFQPANSSMTCYVFNPLTHQFTSQMEYSEYVLDNFNLYTRYVYDKNGNLRQTFRESLKFKGEHLVSENNSDYARFHSNQ